MGVALGARLVKRPYPQDAGGVPWVPALSVVMPARNAGPYLDQAIASILDQSFEDFEFIIRDDGSTDESFAKLECWAARDSRIRLIHGDTLGVVGSSNWIVRRSRAPIVARMDADDLAAPDRLEREIALLREDAEIVMVGSLCRTIDGSGRAVRGPGYWRLVRRACFMPFPHSSIMFRRAAFDRAGGYREASRYWEDLDLALRMERLGKIAVIAEPLVSHRVSAASVRLSYEKRAQIEGAVDEMYNFVAPVDGRGRTGGEAAASERRLRPLVFVSIYSGLLWAGGRPRVLGRMLARSRIGPDLETLLSLSWAILAQTSPGLLRTLIRAMQGARNARARLAVRPGGVYFWRPGKARGPAGQQCVTTPLVTVKLAPGGPEQLTAPPPR